MRYTIKEGVYAEFMIDPQVWVHIVPSLSDKTICGQSIVLMYSIDGLVDEIELCPQCLASASSYINAEAE